MALESSVKVFPGICIFKILLNFLSGCALLKFTSKNKILLNFGKKKKLLRLFASFIVLDKLHTKAEKFDLVYKKIK